MAFVHCDWCPYQKRGFRTHMQGTDAGRRQPSTSQGRRPREEPTLVTDAWASDFQPPGLGEKGTLSRQPQETETPPEKPVAPNESPCAGYAGRRRRDGLSLLLEAAALAGEQIAFVLRTLLSAVVRCPGRRAAASEPQRVGSPPGHAAPSLTDPGQTLTP